MKRYGKWVLIAMASVLLAASAAQAQTKKKRTVKDLKAENARVTTRRQLQQEYDSLAQVLNAAALKMQKVAKAMASKAEAQSQEAVKRLQQAVKELEGKNGEFVIEGDSIWIEDSNRAKGQSVIRGRSQTVTIDGDSVRVKVIENENGNKSVKESVYSKRGKRVRVVGDSVYVESIVDNRRSAASASSGSNTVVINLNSPLTSDELAQLNDAADRVSQWTDSVMGRFGGAVRRSVDAFMAEVDVDRLAGDFERAAAELEKCFAEAKDEGDDGEK